VGTMRYDNSAKVPIYRPHSIALPCAIYVKYILIPHQSVGAGVIAPSDAEVTSAAYLAKTPLV